MSKLTRYDIMMLSSIGLVIVGCWWIYPPAALLVTGLAGIVSALLFGGPERR